MAEAGNSILRFMSSGIDEGCRFGIERSKHEQPSAL